MFLCQQCPKYSVVIGVCVIKHPAVGKVMSGKRSCVVFDDVIVTSFGVFVQ